MITGTKRCKNGGGPSTRIAFRLQPYENEAVQDLVKSGKLPEEIETMSDLCRYGLKRILEEEGYVFRPGRVIYPG